jgi:3-keto-disaccharide hydrolase
MLASSVLLATALLADAKPVTADDYVGRWNVKITDADNTFTGGGFKIEKTAAGLQASLVWRWGSYLPAARAEVVDGVLRIVRVGRDERQDVFEARLEGGVLKGQVRYPEGNVHHFEAKRAPELKTAGAPQWGAPVTLFDGKTLDGWRLRDPKAKMGWAVVAGELAVVDPQGNADLVTDRTFQDLKLHIEFNVEPHSNSGVYLRGRYEVQIESGDPASKAADQKCGSLYTRIAPSVDATKPAGEWQAYDITLVGRRLTVVLNGKTIIDDGLVDGITGGAINPFEDEPGPLMLQGDHGKVRFRNVVVTPAR